MIEGDPPTVRPRAVQTISVQEGKFIVGIMTVQSTNKLSRTDNDAPTDEIDYPDGGFKAWMVVVGAWCAMVPPMGLLNTLAVLQAWISENELEGISE
ncbi:hypothetical protein CDV31_004516, partial [Fusarium ambrosium]